MKISYTIKAFGVFSPKKVKKIHFFSFSRRIKVAGVSVSGP